MKTRSFALCAIALAVSACGGSTGENTENMPGAVSITGTALQGETLTANVSDGDGIDESTLRFQWRSGSSSISGATGPTYVISANEVGDRISVVASYTDNGNSTETLLSVATPEVERLIVNFDGTVSVSGSAIVGETLNAVVSDANGATGDITYTWLADGLDIDGADEASLELTAAQKDAVISVMVSYTDDEGFEETLLSADTTVVLENTVGTVTLSGSPIAGSTLSATVADVDGITGDIVYEWRLDNVAIAGASDSSYTLQDSQIGQAISLLISYADDIGFVESIVVPAQTIVAPAPVNSVGSVMISGDPTVGNTLSSSVIDNNGTSAINYQWMANASAVSGATSASFVVPTNLVGQAISLMVTYTDNDGFDESATSNALTALAIPLVNVNGAIMLSGNRTSGSTLTASISDGNGVPSSVTYAWLADGIVIAGANSNTYTLTDNEIGKAVSVNATYTDNDGFAESLTSDLINVIAAPTVNVVGTVSVTGNPLVGSTLSATVADDNGISTAINYQWIADGVAIAGATNASFVLTTAQTGAVISVMVSYTDDGSTPESLVSAATTAVLNNSTGTVAISGTTTVGNVLSAAVSDTNGLTSSSITYQWLGDGTAISGASSDTFTLTTAQVGQQITVSANYTDDDGFSESIVSPASAAVMAAVANTVGVLSVNNSQKIAVGQSVTTSLSDANTISASPSYVWMADGAAISGATSDQYVPVDADVGKILSVSVSYTDDDGFNESLTATADAFVHTIITESLSELVAAADSANDGDIIGIDDGNYANTDRTATSNQIRINDDGMQVVLIQNSTAVLSGAMCFEVQGDNNIIDGLRFENINNLDGSDCITSGGSAITIRGDNVTLRNNTIDSEGTFTTSSPNEFTWIAVRGVGNTLTRNTFTDSSGQKVTFRGGVISVYNNQTVNENQDHTISYNLFKDFGDSVAASSRNSSAYMIQLGRSTGSDSRGTQNTTVEYNLFTNVNIDRRLMKIQSSENHINNNTILDSSGLIALEDGENNEASNNVIISSQSNNSDDGGIIFGPYGHTITNNYMAGLRTTSGDRAGLFANSNVISNSGNSGLAFATVTVANNSIFNSRQPVQFEDSCAGGQFILDFDNNLIAQDEEGVAGDDDNLGLASNGASNAAFRDDCDLNAASDFDNTHVYADAISSSNVSGRTPPDLFNAYASNGADNRFGPRESSSEPGATTEQNANGLWESVAGSVDNGVGVDADLLRIIQENEVGAGSTSTF